MSGGPAPVTYYTQESHPSFVGNGTGDPNIFLTPYRSFSFAVEPDYNFSLADAPHFSELMGEDFTPLKQLFGSEQRFLTEVGSAPTASDYVILDTTKKAVIKFLRYPRVAINQFVAKYTVDFNYTGGVWAYASDGDTIEIYGVDNIRKFQATSINVDDAFGMTITLFQ